MKRGSVVTVNVQAPGVKLRTTARAREDGSKGDKITVESLLDRKSYLAKVTAVDQVDVTPTSSTVEAETVSARARRRYGAQGVMEAAADRHTRQSLRRCRSAHLGESPTMKFIRKTIAPYVLLSGCAMAVAPRESRAQKCELVSARYSTDARPAADAGEHFVAVPEGRSAEGNQTARYCHGRCEREEPVDQRRPGAAPPQGTIRRPIAKLDCSSRG